MTLRPWIEGYETGQRDMLARLTGDIPYDGHPLAPISPRVVGLYWAWCLAHNLRVVLSIAARDTATLCARCALDPTT